MGSVMQTFFAAEQLAAMAQALHGPEAVGREIAPEDVRRFVEQHGTTHADAGLVARARQFFGESENAQVVLPPVLDPGVPGRVRSTLGVTKAPASAPPVVFPAVLRSQDQMDPLVFKLPADSKLKDSPQQPAAPRPATGLGAVSSNWKSALRPLPRNFSWLADIPADHPAVVPVTINGQQAQLIPFIFSFKFQNKEAEHIIVYFLLVFNNYHIVFDKTFHFISGVFINPKYKMDEMLCQIINGNQIDNREIGLLVRELKTKKTLLWINENGTFTYRSPGSGRDVVTASGKKFDGTGIRSFVSDALKRKRMALQYGSTPLSASEIEQVLSTEDGEPSDIYMLPLAPLPAPETLAGRAPAPTVQSGRKTTASGKHADIAAILAELKTLVTGINALSPKPTTEIALKLGPSGVWVTHKPLALALAHVRREDTGELVVLRFGANGTLLAYQKKSIGGTKAVQLLPHQDAPAGNLEFVDTGGGTAVLKTTNGSNAFGWIDGSLYGARLAMRLNGRHLELNVWGDQHGVLWKALTAIPLWQKVAGERAPAFVWRVEINTRDEMALWKVWDALDATKVAYEQSLSAVRAAPEWVVTTERTETVAHEGRTLGGMLEVQLAHTTLGGMLRGAAVTALSWRGASVTPENTTITKSGVAVTTFPVAVTTTEPWCLYPPVPGRYAEVTFDLSAVGGFSNLNYSSQRERDCESDLPVMVAPLARKGGAWPVVVTATVFTNPWTKEQRLSRMTARIREDAVATLHLESAEMGAEALPDSCSLKPGQHSVAFHHAQVGRVCANLTIETSSTLTVSTQEASLVYALEVDGTDAFVSVRAEGGVVWDFVAENRGDADAPRWIVGDALEIQKMATLMALLGHDLDFDPKYHHALEVLLNDGKPIGFIGLELIGGLLPEREVQLPGPIQRELDAALAGAAITGMALAEQPGAVIGSPLMSGVALHASHDPLAWLSYTEGEILSPTAQNIALIRSATVTLPDGRRVLSLLPGSRYYWELKGRGPAVLRIPFFYDPTRTRPFVLDESGQAQVYLSWEGPQNARTILSGCLRLTNVQGVWHIELLVGHYGPSRIKEFKIICFALDESPFFIGGVQVLDHHGEEIPRVKDLVETGTDVIRAAVAQEWPGLADPGVVTAYGAPVMTATQGLEGRFLTLRYFSGRGENQHWAQLTGLKAVAPDRLAVTESLRLEFGETFQSVNEALSGFPVCVVRTDEPFVYRIIEVLVGEDRQRRPGRVYTWYVAANTIKPAEEKDLATMDAEAFALFLKTAGAPEVVTAGEYRARGRRGFSLPHWAIDPDLPVVPARLMPSGFPQTSLIDRITDESVLQDALLSLHDMPFRPVYGTLVEQVTNSSPRTRMAFVSPRGDYFEAWFYWDERLGSYVLDQHHDPTSAILGARLVVARADGRYWDVPAYFQPKRTPSKTRVGMVAGVTGQTGVDLRIVRTRATLTGRAAFGLHCSLPGLDVTIQPGNIIALLRHQLLLTNLDRNPRQKPLELANYELGAPLALPDGRVLAASVTQRADGRFTLTGHILSEPIPDAPREARVTYTRGEQTGSMRVYRDQQAPLVYLENEETPSQLLTIELHQAGVPLLRRIQSARNVTGSDGEVSFFPMLNLDGDPFTSGRVSVAVRESDGRVTAYLGREEGAPAVAGELDGGEDDVGLCATVRFKVTNDPSAVSGISINAAEIRKDDAEGSWQKAEAGVYVFEGRVFVFVRALQERGGFVQLEVDSGKRFTGEQPFAIASAHYNETSRHSNMIPSDPQFEIARKRLDMFLSGMLVAPGMVLDAHELVHAIDDGRTLSELTASGRSLHDLPLFVGALSHMSVDRRDDLYLLWLAALIHAVRHRSFGTALSRVSPIPFEYDPQEMGNLRDAISLAGIESPDDLPLSWYPRLNKMLRRSGGVFGSPAWMGQIKMLVETLFQPRP